MVQQLNVSLTIPIPNEQVLISKVELEELKEQSLVGLYWNMKDVEERTGKKIDWLKENVLYQPRFKKILDVQTGGFVYYPERKGEKWTFLATKMTKFLEENFYSIFEK
ncbi:DUF771 domain-containing protein [Viridibacillus sp. FSL R5-0468]|uniref:DUF771 domain-containing protein n=1 Tax=Viridibacillus sp. FSL R5-0468 TaxID=2921640 RepID=UPI0030FBE47B